jgi:hypothetical protein
VTRSTTTSVAPNRRKQQLIGGVLVLVVIVGFLSALVLGRGPATAADDPDPTPTPVVTPSPTESPEGPGPSVPPAVDPSETPLPTQPPSQAPEPTEEPSGPAPVVQAPDGVLPPGGIVRVVIDGLKLREGPGLDTETRVVLSRGTLLVVGYSFMSPGFGPVDADGYTWAPVTTLKVTNLPAPGGDPLERGVYGWVAVGSGSTDFLELVPARCVDGDPDLQTILSMTEWERLACFGDRSITLEGTVGCGGCGGFIGGMFEPAWLANPMNYEFLNVDPQEQIGPFSLHYPPGVELIPPASIVRVTGHFDDAAAADCVVAPGDPEPEPISDVLAELFCSQQFVVDSYEILGIDEDFPFS